jgi:hypothetical protein
MTAIARRKSPNAISAPRRGIADSSTLVRGLLRTNANLTLTLVVLRLPRRAFSFAFPSIIDPLDSSFTQFAQALDGDCQSINLDENIVTILYTNDYFNKTRIVVRSKVVLIVKSSTDCEKPFA